LVNSTGEWTDRPISDQFEFVFEIPCGNNGGSGGNGGNTDPTGGLTVSHRLF